MVPLLFRNLLGVTDGEDPGIVHQKVASAEAAYSLIEQVMQLAGAGNVSGDGKGAAPDLATIFSDSFCAPSAQSHACCFVGQGNGSSAAYSASCAGANYDFS